MGVLYQGRCPKCDYTAEFPLGSGFFSMNPMRLLPNFSREEQIVIQNMESKGELCSISVENMLVNCSCCKGEYSLGVKMILSIEDSINQLHGFGGNCEQCGRPLEIVSEQQLKEGYQVMCPKCGEEHLTFQTSGLWG